MRFYIDRNMWVCKKEVMRTSLVSGRWLMYVGFVTWDTKVVVGLLRRKWQVDHTAEFA
jgi:hypothetical protein